MIYIPTIAVNNNTRMWGPDAHKFDPYRWLEPGRLPASSSVTGGINGLFNFIEGPRLCVGYRLGDYAFRSFLYWGALTMNSVQAIFEVKAILSAMIQNFEFKTTGEAINTIWSPGMQPYLRGQKQAGSQLPLLVKPIDA